MGFPDRIERVVYLDRPPPEVWPALTTAEGLSAWFSDQVTIDLRPGGAARLVWEGESYSPVVRIERIEPHRVFAFTWPMSAADADTPRTYVEFTLEAHDGGTRLTVVESGFAQLPDDSYGPTYLDHADGWVRELDELVAYLSV